MHFNSVNVNESQSFRITTNKYKNNTIMKEKKPVHLAEGKREIKQA